MQLLNVHGWQNCHGRVKLSKTRADGMQPRQHMTLCQYTVTHNRIATRPCNTAAQSCSQTMCCHLSTTRNMLGMPVCNDARREELLLSSSGSSSQEQLRSSIVQCTRYATAMEGSIAVHAVD